MKVLVTFEPKTFLLVALCSNRDVAWIFVLVYARAREKMCSLDIGILAECRRHELVGRKGSVEDSDCFLWL